MSTPASRLSKFRSYSYYHILVMCDCSETADELSTSTDVNVWMHATDATKAPPQTDDYYSGVEDLGIYSPKLVNPKDTTSGRYIVLINGSTDASYVIQRATWSTVTAADAVPRDRGTSIAIEGNISVAEPKGVAFLDQIVKCSVALGVDSSQVVYVLKTIFVGHLDEQDTNDVAIISDVPGLTFITYDATGSFTERGGEYEMSFVGAGHGAARLPQYSKAVTSLNITAGDSLQQTLQKLQDNINSKYDTYYDCVYRTVLQMDGGADLAKTLRRVTYEIEVGPDYLDKNGQIKYTISNQTSMYKNNAGCNDKAQISFPAHTSIESAIASIMQMCPQVQAEAASGDPSNKIKYEYKIHSGLRSKRASDGKMDYSIYYRVERFVTPKTIASQPNFEVLATVNDDQLKKDPIYDLLRRNIIEFDYMYTGRNIDVLEFDMKVNLGMAYLQTATLSNTFKGQRERTPNSMTQPSAADAQNQGTRWGRLVQNPVFFGSHMKSPMFANQQNASTAIQSAYTMSKHSSLEVTEASMTITGNDLLLGSANKSSSPEAIKRAAKRKMDQTSSPTEANFADWSLVPAYAKVRIKMPRNNNDIDLFTGAGSVGGARGEAGSTDYAVDFWFDGYYYVYSMDHIFDNGVFTQKLQMLGIPKRSAFEAAKTNTSRDIVMPSAVDSCFNNAIGCGASPTSGSASQTQPSVAVPSVPSSGSTQPTTRQDAQSSRSSSLTPSDVVGWDTADPSVRAAIVDASNRYGVDIVTLAQFAAQESELGRNMKAPKGTAVGLFQFIEQTWKDMVKQGKVVGLTDPNVALRMNHTYNAYAASALLTDNAAAINSKEVGDLYLAHFLGAGATRRVIIADRGGRGGVDLATIMDGLFKNKTGAQWLAEVREKNPTVPLTNSTVLRNWAAQVMAKQLKRGIPVATSTATASTGAPSSSTSPPATQQRTATQPISAVQDCVTQEAKTETAASCGPRAEDTQK